MDFPKIVPLVTLVVLLYFGQSLCTSGQTDVDQVDESLVYALETFKDFRLKQKQFKDDSKCFKYRHTKDAGRLCHMYVNTFVFNKLFCKYFTYLYTQHWKMAENLSDGRQKRSTEGCSKLKNPETRQVNNRKQYKKLTRFQCILFFVLIYDWIKVLP